MKTFLIIISLFWIQNYKIYAQHKVDSKVLLNENFQIELKSPFVDAGYTWVWNHEQTKNIVDSIGFSFVVDNPQDTGSGGSEIWQFIGKKEGIDTLYFEYKRTWEKNSTLNSLAFIVEVDNIFSSINNEINTEIVFVYPNPVNNQVSIFIRNFDFKNYIVELYDLNGVRLINKRLDNNFNVLKINELQSNLYLIRILRDNYEIYKGTLLKY